MCERAKIVAIRKCFLVCCEWVSAMPNIWVAIRNAWLARCSSCFVACKTFEKRGRKPALFDRLEKGMACCFSEIR